MYANIKTVIASSSVTLRKNGQKTTGTHTTIKSVIHCSLLLDRELIEKIPDADKCAVENKYICIAFTTEQGNDANVYFAWIYVQHNNYCIQRKKNE